MFENCKWIWQNNCPKTDEHAEFITKFTCSQTDKDHGVKLYISADTDFGVYVNGKLVEFGQYPDYPHYKTYEELDLTPFVQAGENMLALQGWYYGESTSTYCKGQAGVLFSVMGKTQLCTSGEQVLSRLSKTYQSYLKKSITPQMGFSYSYDAKEEDGWQLGGGECFAPAVAYERAMPTIARPIVRLQNQAPITGKIIKTEKGRYLLDFGAETVGVFRLRFVTKCAQKVHISGGLAQSSAP